MPKAKLPDKVKALLDPGEEVIHAVKKVLTLEKPKWLIVTTKRVIVFDEKILGRYEMKSIPYERLEKVHYEKGVMGSVFQIIEEDGSKTLLTWMDKQEGTRAIEAIRDALTRIAVEPPTITRKKGLIREEITLVKPREAIVRSKVSPQPPPGTAIQKTDPYEELIKLKKLLDKGLITEEEFQQLKKKILEKI